MPIGSLHDSAGRPLGIQVGDGVTDSFADRAIVWSRKVQLTGNSPVVIEWVTWSRHFFIFFYFFLHHMHAHSLLSCGGIAGGNGKQILDAIKACNAKEKEVIAALRVRELSSTHAN
jgi:hypothetical protein